MDARQRFKFGFISAMIKAGHTTPAAIDAAVKQAMGNMAREKLAGFLGDAAKGVGDIVSTGLGWSIPLALAAPPVLGYMGGQMAARATDVDEFDTTEAKKQEVIDEYNRQAEKARRTGLIRKRLQSQTSPSRVFL